jgi:hypothetical protein
MVRLKRAFRRLVTIRASDPAIKRSQWVLSFGPRGLTVRRYGTTEDSHYLSWRSIIGYALVHACRAPGRKES